MNYTKVIPVFGLAVLISVSTWAAPVVLSSADGDFTGLPGRMWIDPGPTVLTYEVTQNISGSWHYAYTLTVPDHDISHFILEVSPGFNPDNPLDFFNATGNDTDPEMGDFTQLNGNPDIPQTLHGIKFEPINALTMAVAFDSWRAPVEGHFYARCGHNPPSQVWNFGETPILVPDTVPEPASALVVGFSLFGLAGMRRRKRGE